MRPSRRHAKKRMARHVRAQLLFAVATSPGSGDVQLTVFERRRAASVSLTVVQAEGLANLLSPCRQSPSGS